VRRGARNRIAILDALWALVSEGALQPTAEQVAVRAGVGTRTVFRHFADMDSLHAEISQRMRRSVAPLLTAAGSSGNLEERARDLVARRVALYERVAPFKRSAILHRRRSPFLQRQHQSMVRELRKAMLAALPELLEAAAPLVEGLDVVLSFEAWDRLRVDQRLGRERAEAALAATAQGLLAQLER